MALARYSPFSPRQADRLFGSVVRYWVGEGVDRRVVFVVFACGCVWSERNEVRRKFCRRHRVRVIA